MGSSRRAVVVSLPTSSGKTLIAQFRILQALNQFEHEHGIVFPETTIIVRDIQKLLYKIIELRGLRSQPDDVDEDEMASGDSSIYGI